MRWLPFLILVSMTVPAISAETEDPLVSLFHFQMRMAEGGNVRAMMKVGEMYEKGEGTLRDYRRALEMYRKARAAGATDAGMAIRRVEEKLRATTAKKANQTRKQNTPPTAFRSKPNREAVTRKAAQERAQREAATRRAAQEKARREAAARRAAQEKARREAAARRAAQEKARREAAARKAAEERARREDIAEPSAREALPVDGENASRPPEQPGKSGEDASSSTKTFTSDPCKTRAARFLESCKRKR